MADKYDLVVIGSGPGGYVAAIRASQLGVKTAVVERAEVGGICLNWGCIPTKALLHSASLFQQVKNAKKFGVHVPEVAIDFPGMIKHSRDTANRLSKGIDFLFRKNNIAVVAGTAKIIARGKVEVTADDKSTKLLEAADILIATGARPRSIPNVKIDGKKIITSREAMVLQNQPGSMVIIGAGAIGVEFAYFYSSLGTEVTLIEMMDQILPIEDKEVVEVVARSFKKMGIDILTGTRVEKIRSNGKGITVVVSSKDGEREIKGDLSLVAIGVTGNVEHLGLEALGVITDRSFIQVDKRTYRTNVEGIYAIGDVIGPPWLAHVASAEGVIAAELIAGHESHPVLPRADGGHKPVWQAGAFSA